MLRRQVSLPHTRFTGGQHFVRREIYTFGQERGEEEMSAQRYPSS